MRSEMEVELAEMERSALASEKAGCVTTRSSTQSEISNLQNQLEHEHDRRREHKDAIKQSIEVQLRTSIDVDLNCKKNVSNLEYNQHSAKGAIGT